MSIVLYVTKLETADSAFYLISGKQVYTVIDTL